MPRTVNDDAQTTSHDLYEIEILSDSILGACIHIRTYVHTYSTCHNKTTKQDVGFVGRIHKILVSTRRFVACSVPYILYTHLPYVPGMYLL